MLCKIAILDKVDPYLWPNDSESKLNIPAPSLLGILVYPFQCYSDGIIAIYVSNTDAPSGR